MPTGDDTPEISDGDVGEHYEVFGDDEDMDPGGVSPFGEVGEAPGVIPGADPDPQGQAGVGDEADHPPPDPPPQARPSVSDKLRAEAESVEHKLSHLQKNPFCQACTMGKMKEKYSRRSAFKRELMILRSCLLCVPTSLGH